MPDIFLVNLKGKKTVDLATDYYPIFDNISAKTLDVDHYNVADQQIINLLLLVPSKNADASNLLIAHAKTLNLESKILKICEPQLRKTKSIQNSNGFILTLISDTLCALVLTHLINEITNQGLVIQSCAQLNNDIDHTRNITTSILEFRLTGKQYISAKMYSAFSFFAAKYNIDVAIQKNDFFYNNKRLVCFDMDSTLIKTEVIDELAKHAGVGAQVSEITKRAMQGEIDFSESFTQRMALLKGVNVSVLIEIANNLPLMDGVDSLMKNLKFHGFKIAILSGGFSYFAKILQSKFDIDHVYANTLQIENRKLTGHVVQPIVDAKYKAFLLKKIAKKEGLDLRQTVAVGDGANDLEMIDVAGLGVAFHAKPIVRESAKVAISNFGLDSLIYLLGYNQNQLSNT